MLFFNATSADAEDRAGLYNTEKGDPISPEQALQGIEVPDGFHVSLFASEPDVQQPIALTTDDRGRVWIAENYTYAEAVVNFDEEQYDRIVILEDANGDGKADR